MATPQQVRQRAEQIDSMYAQPNQEQNDQQQGEPQGNQPQGDQPQADQQAELQADQQADQQGDQQQGDQQQGEPQGDQQPVQVQNPDDVAQELSQLRKQVEQSDQRFKTLQGMQQRTEQENQRLQTLLSQMAEQNTQQPQNDQQQQSQQSATDPGETQDREDFGSDFVDMVNRAIDRRIQGFEKRLGHTEGMAEQSYASARKTEQQKFEENMTKLVSDWREIDQSQEFMNWLNQSQTRLAIVKQGMANYDSEAIAEVFQLYKQLNGTGQPEANNDSPPAPPKNKLEGKVSPATGRASKPKDAPEEPKVWTKSEIAQVFRDRRNIPKKEFDELQKEIFKAQGEGRVDYTR